MISIFLRKAASIFAFVLLLGAAIPPSATQPDYGSTPRLALQRPIDALVRAEPNRRPMRFVRTNVAGDHALVLTQEGRLQGLYLAEHFSFGWQPIGEVDVDPCLFKARRITDAQETTLLAGMPKLQRGGNCHGTRGDLGSTPDVASVRKIANNGFDAFVGVSGDYAYSTGGVEMPTCEFFRRDAGAWRFVTGCKAEVVSGFVDGLADAGFSLRTLCAIGYGYCIHNGILDKRLEHFRSPTGNIGCYASESLDGSLRCDVVGGIVPLPPKPSDCSAGWGRGYVIESNGSVKVVCDSGSVLHKGPVLEYGTTVEDGNTSCTSRETGITCKGRGGHGFLLARGEANTF